MNGFRVGKVDTKELNSTLLEMKKVLGEQRQRNINALASLKKAYETLASYETVLDSSIQNLTYYLTYYTAICEKNGV